VSESPLPQGGFECAEDGAGAPRSVMPGASG